MSRLPLIGFALAGGKGQRLAPLTSLPGGQIRSKALVSFLGKPIFSWQLAQFGAHGLSSCLVVARGHYNREPLRQRFGYRQESIALAYSAAADDALDTGSADATLRNALQLDIDRPILIFPTDSLFDIDLEDLYRFHLQHRADLTVGTVLRPDHQVADCYGVAVAKGPRITRFVEKPSLAQLHALGNGPWPTNSGIYLVSPKVLRAIAESPIIAGMRRHRLDFGLDLLPWMVAEGFHICHYDNMWVGDLGAIPAFLTTMREVLHSRDNPWQIPAPEPNVLRARWLPNIHPSARVVDSWIGRGVVIGPDARIAHSWIGDDVEIGTHAIITGSHIEASSYIGPGAEIHRSVLGESVHMGSSLENPTQMDGYSGVGDLSVIAAGSSIHASIIDPQTEWPTTNQDRRQTS